MAATEVNNSFIGRIKKIIYQYEAKIPKSLFNFYREILEGKNIEDHMQAFSLSKEELIKYARVCKIMDIYKDISDLIKILEEELQQLDLAEREEYEDTIAELKEEGEEYLDVFEQQEHIEETELKNDRNLIIYPGFINESREKTMSSHSGKEEQTLKVVANIIEQMRMAEYHSLRKKGYIHQNQIIGSNKQYYVEGNAFERMGRGSTKVNYIRIPINENNRSAIKKHLNIDFEMLYLVVRYGDFKNEGLDEIKFYNDVYLDLKKHYNEIVTIINIFKNNFTHETLPIAIDIITNGFKLTDDFISMISKKEF